MSSGEDIRADLSGITPDEELDALVQFAQWLEAERPVPSSAFRGELGRQLRFRAGARPGSLPRHRMRIVIAAYTCGGLLLLGFATLGVAGVGPLAA